MSLSQFAVRTLDAEVEQEGQQPLARERIVVLRQDSADTRRVIRAGRKVGAEQEEVAGSHEVPEAGTVAEPDAGKKANGVVTIKLDP